MTPRTWICLALALAHAPAFAQSDADGLVGQPILRHDKRYGGQLQLVNRRLTLVSTGSRSTLEVGQDRLADQLRSLEGWNVELAAHEHDGLLYPTELLSPRPETVRGWVQRGAAGLELRPGSSPSSAQPLRDPGGAVGHALGDQAGPRSLTLRVLKLGREPGAVDELRVLAVEARVTRPGKLFAQASDVFRTLWAHGTGEVGGAKTRGWLTHVRVEDGRAAGFLRHEAQVYTERRDPWDGTRRTQWTDQVTSGYIDAAALELGDEVATVEGELRVTPSTLHGMHYTGGAAYQLTFPDDVALVTATGEVLDLRDGTKDDERLTQLRQSPGRRVRITAVRQGSELRLGPLATTAFLPAGQQEGITGALNR